MEDILTECHQFILAVYNFRNAEGELPFNTIDYYTMDDLLSKLQAAITAQEGGGADA